ncbi:MAG: TIGR03617 family F420-dependent LLM class oxidoreductase [Halieaceae bacterium]|jgi:probable F420-dependent oxidoreductase|nr:TIGR03617 family F420-dependent LLM class oxidoreductase [Halieaceae bacterium]
MGSIKIDTVFGHGEELASTESMGRRARELEELGFDGLMVAEIAHDPFQPLIIAAHNTATIELRTAIAVALARSPMTMANSAHDVNAWSGGRFSLGIGSQIKPHITRRFSMPWHGPAKQMREYIESLRAIWDCWYDGKPLDYRGECYQHTLMTPEFTPTNTEHGRPPILMAAVGPLMLKTACAVADGLIVHSFCTERHFKNVMLPLLETELAANGRSLDDFIIQFPVFTATGTTEEELEKAKRAIKYRIGFYGSTPAYKTVLDTHDWGDLQPILNRMTKEGQWDALPDQISDEMLETFAAVGEPVAAAQVLADRFGGVIDRTLLEAKYSPDILDQQIKILKSAA